MKRARTQQSLSKESSLATLRGRGVQGGWDTYTESLPLVTLESAGVGGDLLDDFGLSQGLDCHYL